MEPVIRVNKLKVSKDKAELELNRLMKKGYAILVNPIGSYKLLKSRETEFSNWMQICYTVLYMIFTDATIVDDFLYSEAHDVNDQSSIIQDPSVLRERIEKKIGILIQIKEQLEYIEKLSRSY